MISSLAVTTNPTKCGVLPVKSLCPAGIYQLGGYLLNEVECEKDLGVYVCSSLETYADMSRKVTSLTEHKLVNLLERVTKLSWNSIFYATGHASWPRRSYCVTFPKPISRASPCITPKQYTWMVALTNSSHAFNVPLTKQI